LEEIIEAVLDEHATHDTCGYDIGCVMTSEPLRKRLTQVLQDTTDKYWAKGHEAGTKEARQDLLKEMMEECNRTENEAGRLLVEQFNGK
jgi:hypothetical protein